MATAANVGSANAYGRGAFPRTPATPGEALNAYTPAPTTPMSYGGIIEPRTPANVLEPRTPAPIGNEPRTPAPLMEPATPAPMLEPRTPAPGIEPATPMMHSIEPQTPMMTEPQTPHTPAMVPHTPAPPNEEFEDAASMGYKVLVDVNVSVPSENGNTGVVLDADVHGTVLKVKLISGPNAGNVVKLGGDGITPVQPKSEINPHQLEMVKVLDGGHQGRMGRLTRVNVPSDNPNEATGIIQFDHGQEELLLALVAKCVDPNEPS